MLPETRVKLCRKLDGYKVNDDKQVWLDYDHGKELLWHIKLSNGVVVHIDPCGCIAYAGNDVQAVDRRLTDLRDRVTKRSRNAKVKTKTVN